MTRKILLQWPSASRVYPTEDVPQPRLEEDSNLCQRKTMEMNRKVARPDTQIDWRDMGEKYGGSNIYSYPVVLNHVLIVNKFILAEQQGYDAVIPALYIDDGLQEGRGTLRIPVVGPGEASMLIAQLVGRRFAVVTVRPELIPRIEENLHQFGWEDRAIRDRPVRSFSPWYQDACRDAFNGKPEKLIADFEKVAMECITAGADTIIIGCYPASVALTLAGYHEIGNTGVPFISPAACAIKLAEMMVDLQQSVGLVKTEFSGGPYKTLPKKMLEQIWQDFDFLPKT